MKSAVALLTLALVGYVWCCQTDSDCSATQCCLNQNILIASKRQLEGILPVFNERGGKCVDRQGQGSTCYSFTACGCMPGLKCQTLEHPLASQLIRRMVYFTPGTCEADPLV